MVKFVFCKDFLWGAATSAHQVDGGMYNQWTLWERENARVLAVNAKREFGDLPSWPDVKSQAEKPDNYISGQAANHRELYESDFNAAEKMGLNAFRFSVEWSRMEPEAGKWNAAEFAHYKKYIKAMKSRGLEPVMTLFHFTLPIWFAEMGGFEKRGNVQYFTRFAKKVLKELGAQVQYVITINEPEIYAFESYYAGNWPPQLKSPIKMYRVLANLAYAHNQIATFAHAQNKRWKLSIAKNSAYIYAGDDAVLTRKTAEITQWLQDDFTLKRVAKNCDFLGVNYYLSQRYYGYRSHNPDAQRSDLGWDLQPADLRNVLERLDEKYHLPILICENGLADANDTRRTWWLRETIAAMSQAIENGVNLLGYLHWSLIDNFEWDKGFWPRFGLFAVDYENNFKRRPRKSAIWFGKFVRKVRGL